MAYNGWANYNTWAVALWLDNDQGTYTYWRERAAEVREENTEEEGDGENPSPAVDMGGATADLADALRAEADEGNPLSGQASMYADLMNAALSEVDWHEIARHILSEE